jgi:hypothetical protein
MKLFRTEPVLTLGGIAAAIVALLAVFGVVVETSLIETLVAVLVPLALAVAARRHVTPNAKVAAKK